MQVKSSKFTKRIISMMLMIVMVFAVCVPATAHTSETALEASTIELNVGEMAKLKIGGGSILALWKSNDASIARVNMAGLVTAVSEGETTVKATAVTVFGTIVTKEFNIIVSSIDADVTVKVGDTAEIDLGVEDGTTYWISNNPYVATVENGVVTAVSKGVATVTATTIKQSGFYCYFIWIPSVKIEVDTFVVHVTGTDADIEDVPVIPDAPDGDRDNDGLTDEDEADIYGTDPDKYDTDGDGLSDGDEIAMGLDPLEQKTDGETLDSERIIEQELKEENIDDTLIGDDNDAIPSLTLSSKLNINRTIKIVPTASDDFTDSRALVGKAIDIRESGESIEEGVLSFTLNKKYVQSITKDGVEEKINTAIICKYNADGTTEYLDTEYSESVNTVSAKIKKAGTYFVLDVKSLFDELGYEFPTEANGGVTDAPAKPETDTAMAQADIVFIIDTTGSMGGEIDNVKNNIQYFVDTLKAKGVSAGFALIDYQDLEADGYDSTRVHKNGESNWFYDVDAYKNAIENLDLGYGGDAPECAVDALETARLLDMRESAGKIFILVTDADYKVDNRYDIPSMEAEIELLKNSGVTCAVVSDSYDKEIYYDLYTETNGVWADIYGDFYSELTALADKIGDEIVGEGCWIYLNGPVPVPVRLDAEPTEGSTVDTDKDGIPDVVELGGAEPTAEIDLDALLTKVSGGVITGTSYGSIFMYKYISNPAVAD